jgi:hypothetical protein
MDSLGHLQIVSPLTIIDLEFVVLGNELLQGLKFFEAEISY